MSDVKFDGNLRGNKYGPISENCKGMKAIMEATFTPEELAEYGPDVAVFSMIAMKMTRRKYSKMRDHDIDIINYMKLLMSIVEYEEE